MVQGTYTTASSNLLKNYKSAYTATAIQKLLDAGAIPLVKENCDSFGHGSSSENTIFGAVKNDVRHFFQTEFLAFLLSQNPPHSIHDIGFPTAIRAYNTSDIFIDIDDRSLCKTFEAFDF